VRAISVKQPWAWAIVDGGKNIENRGRSTPWRTAIGEVLAIHASLSYDEDAYSLPLATAHGLRLGFADPVHPMKNDELFPRGFILGQARLYDVHHWSQCEGACSPWAQPDQWHLRFHNAEPWTEPVPARGALGLWTLADLPTDVQSPMSRWRAEK
jgi:hypothetical protein